MIICVLKETKEHEGRVALTPANVGVLTSLKHVVYVQKKAGLLSGFDDHEYGKAGARLFEDSAKPVRSAGLVLKVKEPTIGEISLMRPGQMIFCFLHLAAFPQILKKILGRKIIALGYETLRLPDGSLPLLRPMSEIAGKLAAQNGAHFLRSDCGGRGILMGGTEKVRPAEVVVLGCGTVGENAAKVASGMGAKTSVVDISKKRLAGLRKKYPQWRFYLSAPRIIGKLVPKADLVIGAVLVPGARAPRLVTEAMVKKMRKGSVIVDVAVDQGGCVETSVVTSHKKPVKVCHGVLHYGVPNIPAVVPVTGTHALTRETFPYVKRLAQFGLVKSCERYPEMKWAVNCAWGKIVHPALTTPR